MNHYGQSLLQTLNANSRREFDSAWKPTGRYGHDEKTLSTTLKTTASLPEKEQALIIQQWAETERKQSEESYQQLLDCTQKNNLHQLVLQMTQMGDPTSQGLPSTVNAGNTVDSILSSNIVANLPH